MDEVIHRQIWLMSRHVVAPIEIVSGSQIPIRLEIMDYTILAGAIAKVYSTAQNGGPVYITPGTVHENTVTFTPPDGFFTPGRNRMQLELNDKIIPLSLEVICQSRVSLTGDPATPEAVTPLTLRAETAANSAESSAAAAAESASSAQVSASVTENPPYVGNNGNWMVWDKATKKYVDSGTRAQGPKGDASYVHIRYAAQQPSAAYPAINATPSDWMGIYSGTEANAPASWSSYTWYNIKGATGANGEQGINLLKNSDLTIAVTRDSVSYVVKSLKIVESLNPQELIGKTLTASAYINSPGTYEQIDNSPSSIRNRFGFNLNLMWGDSNGVKANKVEYPLANLLFSVGKLNEKVKGTYTIYAPDGYDTLISITLSPQITLKPDGANNAIWTLARPKLEIGDVYNPIWTPSPEDGVKIASEALSKSGGTMTGTLTTKGIVLTQGVDYGDSLPSTVTPGKLFFKKVS